MAIPNQNFTDFFGNEVKQGDFIAYASNGRMEVFQVKKMFIDSHGSRKLSVHEVHIASDGSYIVSKNAKYAWDFGRSGSFPWPTNAPSGRMILLRHV